MMDIHMPVMDGFTAVRLIRNIKELCEVSIVAFSAFLDGDRRQHALDAGCNDYVNKMEGINQLSSIVRQYLPAA
jgi:CheY-like chemotaxis protein